ncbi:ABC transporter substrate-binding protein [Natrinema pellirubrum DSM 15624]|uniref:ABC transporter periplasmic binding protein, thiB subfamily n=1 Tax=Natrinema pellirubrum (strain DSM 15624 / CIP 106293 / JCM 10476 / NCIMB 786 / 157) TaxID=797303 RepID=L0JSI8_NATP1|nr:thiamine ABC transporter substrate-binding protein [Natrinema pellirubrum]AGB33622.1 ABC transporter periplasmic binding protein, thiB subfamily [Natrinema pellirubrum DSM 15624]ELY70479.1 ABC transporter substrate-binding protein [Natrinema pellirubrum DSM 15624]
MDRRTFIGTVGAGTVAGVAGCLTRDGDGNGDDGSDGDPEPENPDLEGELRVATYSSMVDGENPAGEWLKEVFEEEYPDAELTWTVPENGINQYIERERSDVDLDADVYLGANVDDLVLVDDRLEEGGLLRDLNVDRIDNAERIRDGLDMGDPHGRVLAYDTGYISLVYDETVVDEPETLADLTEPAYEDALLAQNAQSSDPGQAFLLWTIDAYGEDGYLDYWDNLAANGVRILKDWSESYSGAYMEEERPMVVSYSTDQVYANEYGYDMRRHQVAFPNDQGYANPEGMGIFEGASELDLAYEFLDFALSSEAQAVIAQRNVQFPAVEEEFVDLDDEFDQYAHVPPEAVTVGYDRLRGNLEGWVDDWAREFAGQ